jgi:hypothetical protein
MSRRPFVSRRIYGETMRSAVERLENSYLLAKTLLVAALDCHEALLEAIVIRVGEQALAKVKVVQPAVVAEGLSD